jgi:hypothetical protein
VKLREKNEGAPVFSRTNAQILNPGQSQKVRRSGQQSEQASLF